MPVSATGPRPGAPPTEPRPPSRSGWGRVRHRGSQGRVTPVRRGPSPALEPRLPRPSHTGGRADGSYVRRGRIPIRPRPHKPSTTTGALTEATPRSRSSTLSAQPARGPTGRRPEPSPRNPGPSAVPRRQPRSSGGCVATPVTPGTPGSPRTARTAGHFHLSGHGAQPVSGLPSRPMTGRCCRRRCGPGAPGRAPARNAPRRRDSPEDDAQGLKPAGGRSPVAVPVDVVNSASDRGPPSRATRISMALSSTPTPLTLVPTNRNSISECRMQTCGMTYEPGPDPRREGVGASPGPRGRRRTRPPLHRPPPGPRGDLAAGLRRAPHGRSRRPPA